MNKTKNEFFYDVLVAVTANAINGMDLSDVHGISDEFLKTACEEQIKSMRILTDATYSAAKSMERDVIVCK